MKIGKGGAVITTQSEELLHIRVTYSGTALFEQAPEDLYETVRLTVKDMLSEKGLEIAPTAIGKDSFRLGLGRKDYVGWSCDVREKC
jgi:hypothetical protein